MLYELWKDGGVAVVDEDHIGHFLFFVFRHLQCDPTKGGGVVNYADLLKNTDNRCHLSLKSVPIGVRRARINPADVEYVIEDSSPDDLE